MVDSSIRFAFAGVIGFASVQLVARLSEQLGPGALLITPVLFLVASYWAAASLEEQLPGALPCLSYSIVLAGMASVVSWDAVSAAGSIAASDVLSWQLAGFTAGGALLALLPASRQRGLGARLFLAFAGGGTVSAALSTFAMTLFDAPSISAVAFGLVSGLAATGAAIAELTAQTAAPAISGELGDSLSRG
jgi:hypothetical protein